MMIHVVLRVMEVQNLSAGKNHVELTVLKVRAANIKTNKSSTIYGTDSYVVSLAAK